MRLFLNAFLLLCLLYLQACSTPEPARTVQSPKTLELPQSQLANQFSWNNSRWQHLTLPSKKQTLYTLGNQQGRDTIQAHATSSASMLRQDLQIAAADLNTVKFSWHVPELIRDADLAERDFDDSPVRIVLVFAGDKSKFSAKNAMLSEMAELLSGESLPYATLMYVWCNKREAGSVVVNPRTDRIRSIVVESGARNLRQWLDYERNIRADYEKAFGEAPGDLLRVGIMTDSDNTQSQTVASYGSMHFGKTSSK
jgi:Protein of unknown function (DUF3047)